MCVCSVLISCVCVRVRGKLLDNAPAVCTVLSGTQPNYNTPLSDRWLLAHNDLHLGLAASVPRQLPEPHRQTLADALPGA